MSDHRNSKQSEYGGSGGMAKHRKSGKAPKSPKLRMKMQLEAQKTDIKGLPSLPYGNVSELFKGDKK